MALRDDIKLIVKTFEEQSEDLEYAEDLYKIHEGALKPYVEEELRRQLNPKSAANAIQRIAPINILKRLIDKLSKLYAKPPTRKLMLGDSAAGESDNTLFGKLVTDINMNRIGVTANKAFNLNKCFAYEPILMNGAPKVRVLQRHQFFVMGVDLNDPLKVTHFIKIMGKIDKEDGRKVTLLFCYTDEEFLAITADGEIARNVMDRPEIAELNGLNPIRRIPFVYVSRSETELTPLCDTDMKAMVVLVPVLLTDINYALMYQCFSILTFTNVKEEGIKRSPDIAWYLQKEDPSGPDPRVDVVKPQVDSDKALSALKSELSLWMTSKNIKPGAMGDMSIENLASGVAKIIDESDTSEDRQNQVPYMQDGEEKLLDLVVNFMHPHWLGINTYKYKQTFSKGLVPQVSFPEQKPVIDSTKAITDQQTKITMGIQSKKGALRELNPDWTEDEIDAKLDEISMENQAATDQAEESNESADEELNEMAEMQSLERSDALTEQEPTVGASSGGGSGGK